MIRVVEPLNSFASNEVVQPSEDVFVLSSSELQAIIEKATAPLLQRIEGIEMRLDAHSAKLFNKRITQKSLQWVDDLHDAMFEDKVRDVTLVRASRMLGISKERVRQLVPLIARDGRFVVGWNGQTMHIILRVYF